MGKSILPDLQFLKAPDVKIVCGNMEFLAHKDVLAEKSPVFRQMFESEMTESLTGKLVLDEKEIAPNSVLQMLHFLYSGKMEESKDVCRDLFVAGEKYDMKGLKERSEGFLADVMKPEEAAELYTLAETYGGSTLQKEALTRLKCSKKRLFPNPEALHAFAIKYPQLMFQVFMTDDIPRFRKM